MDIHRKPIGQRIAWLFDLADRHGANFRSPEAWLARERYLADRMTMRTAVLDWRSRRLEVIGEG